MFTHCMTLSVMISIDKKAFETLNIFNNINGFYD